jgi:hypothetical protein
MVQKASARITACNSITDYLDVLPRLTDIFTKARVGSYYTFFFLSAAFTQLQKRYVTDLGRGGHLIRDSAFFFNSGDSKLTNLFLAYYSSFFYNLLTPAANITTLPALPDGRGSILSGLQLAETTAGVISSAATDCTRHGARAYSTPFRNVSSMRDITLTRGGSLAPRTGVILRKAGHMSTPALHCATTLNFLAKPETRLFSSQSARSRMRGSLGSGITAGKAQQRAHSQFTDMPVFQMKPGYLGLWRHYRSLFAKYSPLRYFRQRRWTNYFLSLKSLSGSPVLLSLEFSCLAILKSSQFFFLAADVTAALFAGCVYVNGIVVLQPTSQLYAGDCVQLLVSWRLLAYYATGYNYYIAMKHRLIPKMLATVSNMSAGFDNADFLQLLNKFSIGNFDVPNYLEVDYLSSSIFVVYSPIFSFELSPVISAISPAFAMRLYNWKYVN